MQNTFDSLMFSPVQNTKEKQEFKSTFLSNQNIVFPQIFNYDNLLINNHQDNQSNDDEEDQLDNLSFMESNSINIVNNNINDESFLSQKPKELNVSKTQKKKQSGCKCKNSNCLRLHCSCFKNQGYCGPQCKCLNCRNNKKYDEARQFVIDKTKMIYKKAFQSKTTFIKNIKGKQINVDGCNCSKGCQNQYCGCKKLNGVCSPICRCVDCKNDKIELTKQEIQQIYKPCSRKKHKLIFNFAQEENQNKMNQSQHIIFKKYKTQKYI